MNLPILADITNIGEVAQTIVYVIPPEFEIMFWGSLIFDVIIFAYLFYTIYKDMTGIWAIDETTENSYKLRRFSAKDIKAGMLTDRADKKNPRTFTISTKVGMLKKPLGIYVPFYLLKSEVAGTTSLLDPRDPDKKSLYFSPEVLAKGLECKAEQELTTVRIDKGGGEIIGFVALGIVAGILIDKFLLAGV